MTRGEMRRSDIDLACHRVLATGSHKRFGRAIALRRTYWRGQWLKTQLASEAARAMVDVGRAVVCPPFDELRDLRLPRRCSTAASSMLRTSSPLYKPVVTGPS
jgi:hypothetical protein